MTDTLPKVLHVDDDLDILEVSRLALETVGGLEVVQFSSGFKAVENATALHPDFFLLDVMMPEIDGIETLQKLRDIPEFSGTPAVFMTAKASPDDITALLKCGAVSVIKKPFDPMTLAGEIVDLWQNSRQDIAAA